MFEVAEAAERILLAVVAELETADLGAGLTL